MNREPSNRIVSPDISAPIELQRSSWKSKYEQICAIHVTNGESEVETPSNEKGEEEGQVQEMQKPNALIGLSGYLSSSEESECEDSELSGEVKTFLKEVDSIDAVYKTGTKADSSKKSGPAIGWQECYDQSTGYIYYWNVDTNEVTWSMPEAYKKHLENMKNWQEFQAQAEVAAALQKVRQQQQKQQLQQQQALLKQQALDQLNQIKQAEALKAAKKEKAKAKKLRKATSARQSDSDEEKIELITSYGPDSGDESSTDPETKVEDKPPPVKKKKVVKPPKDPGKDDPPVVMGPQLPPAILKRQRMHSVVLAKNRLVPYQHDSDADESSMPAPPPPPSLNSTDLRRLKSSESVGGRGGGGGAASRRVHGKDDEDMTKVLDRQRSQKQALKDLGGELPSEVKSSSTSDKSSKESVKTKGTDLANGPSRETDLKSLAKAVEPTTSETSSSSSKRKPKIELPYKKNHDVQLPDSGKDDTRGLGFSSTKDNSSKQVHSDQEQIKRAKGDKIMFVKAETLRMSEEDSKGSKESSAEESAGNVDIKNLSSLLLDKMKFLSVGKEPMSPVQIWTVQLETLLTAWEAQQLTSTHITAWLQTTSAELERLEAAGAPDGWLCQWHRSKKCYSYKNLLTSEVVWEYPQVSATLSKQEVPTGPNRGEEDMEVCTTPPPPPSPPRISPPSPPPPISTSPTLSRSPSKKRNCSSPSTGASTLPPLPPMPPPAPQDPPPPPPPDDPPPPPLPLHQTEPLPPGVDPPEPIPLMPVQPIASRPEFALHMQIPAMHTPVCMIPQMHYPLAYPTVPVAPASLAAALPQARSKDGKHDLSSELDIFYNDIAQLEPSPPAPLPPPLPDAVSTPPLPSPPRDPTPPSVPSPHLPLAQEMTSTANSISAKSSSVIDDSVPGASSNDNAQKKKKKTKLAPGLALKKKGVSSLVAKWQQVQEDVRRDLKNIED